MLSVIFWIIKHFNPPTPCGVGLHHQAGNAGSNHISIHPPRVGWDGRKRVELLLLHNFNPPTPCGVGPANGKSAQCSPTFQSTHPVWGGTYSTSSISICPDFNPPTPCGVGLPGASPPVSELPHFNPPTPCGVGHFVQFGRNSVICISIHPPRVGWDLRRRLRLRDISLHFNPPTPCGVGPHNTALSGGNHDFNPPTPCGVGPRDVAAEAPAERFQSTHPVWGGT